MNIHKKITIALIIILITAFAIGCPARRPEAPQEQPDPERIIVPEVSRVFFEEVPLEDGPRLARLLSENNREGEMLVWFMAEDQFWILVQSEAGGDEILEIEEVLQRIPERDTILLEVRLSQVEIELAEEEAEEENQAEVEDERTTLIRLEINQEPHGVAFLVDSELEEDLEENGNNGEQARVGEQQPPREQPQRQPQQQAPQQEQERPQNQQTFIQVVEPEPNQEVSSPLQVLGRARLEDGNVHIRLKSEEGEVIAESNTTVTATAPQVGNFSATLSFSSPEKEESGTLEVYSEVNGETENLIAVPVVIR